MTVPWLHIVGIGEDGLDGLTPATRAVVQTAEVILGGERHLNLAGNDTAERVPWPSPFDAMVDVIRSYQGRRLVVLATGDPLWYSVGARIGRAIPIAEITYHPQLSAFQLVCARLGWSLADLETLTVHGRPVPQIVPFVAPDQRLLILTTGADTPAEVAAWLTDNGYGPSKMHVLGAMGGPNETRFEGVAETWDHDVPAFNTLAVECIASEAARVLPRVGLADDMFVHDGKMTKSEVRAITLSRLMPQRNGLLWDIGAGCGSVGIEWMRAARDARAIGIEPLEARRAMAAQNAQRLGAPRLQLVDGRVPEALAGLEAPDAVFIGGGLSEATVEAAWAALKPHGRLVANAVTLESEAVLMALHKRRGGDLIKLSVHRAEPVGPLTGWRPFMPVTQWSVQK